MFQNMEMHDRKNKGYAEGGAPLGNFERSAAIMANYPDINLAHPAAIAMMFVLKHFDRVMWDLNIGREPNAESVTDIGVYLAIINCITHDRRL